MLKCVCFRCCKAGKSRSICLKCQTPTSTYLTTLERSLTVCLCVKVNICLPFLLLFWRWDVCWKLAQYCKVGHRRHSKKFINMPTMAYLTTEATKLCFNDALRNASDWLWFQCTERWCYIAEKNRLQLGWLRIFRYHFGNRLISNLKRHNSTKTISKSHE